MGENPGGDSRQDWKLNQTGGAPDPGPGKSALSAALNDMKGAWGTRGGKFVAIAPAVVALVVGLLIGSMSGGGTNTVAGPTVTVTETVPGAPQTGDGSGASGAAASDSATAVATDGATGVPSATGSAVGDNSVGTGPAGTGTVSLVNLPAASGAFQSNDTNPIINGKPQLLALVQDMGYNTKSGDAGYNLGRDYTQFTALLGVDDTSAQSSLNPTVEIDGDGLKLAVFTPTLGHPVQITLNVTNVLRLDLIWSTPNAGQKGAPNNSYLSGTLVFGNAQLTTIPGFHPSPKASSAG